MNQRSFATAAVPVAVVGMACRLPGADDLDSFWALIRDARSAVAPLSSERLPRDLFYDPKKGVLNKTYSDLACTIDYRRPPLASTPLPLDVSSHPEPLFAALCETAVRAAEQGGFDPLDMPCRKAGVFIGHTRASGLAGDLAAYALVDSAADVLRKTPAFASAVGGRRDDVLREWTADLRRAALPRDASGGPALGSSLAARMIARTLGLSGPTMAFNSACASSMQAIIQAMRAVQSGRLDLAVAGGASFCHSDTLVLFSQAQSLSASGSRPWDAAADGLVVGEGCVVLLLKRLDRALADGDRIQAVVAGAGASSDGKGKSLWAPRKEGQVAAVRRAYGAHLSMDRLQYIEAHATSTQVGDATEVAALEEALADAVPPGTRIPLGSVKANIGHTLEAAGAAGVLKTILALQRKTIPPVANVRNLNPQIAWDRIPFYLPFAPEEWRPPADGQARRAAVNAFGIGGLNTHLVLDEFVPARAASSSSGVAMPPAAAEEPLDARCAAIVGVGAVLPGARTAEAFFELVRSGADPKSDAPSERWNADLFHTAGPPAPGKSVHRRGGFVRDFSYDWKRHKVPPKQVAQASPLQFMILDAVEDAFRAAGWGEGGSKLPRERTGVVVGTIFGGEFSAQLQVGLMLPQLERALAAHLERAGAAEAERAEVCKRYREALLEKMPALLDETGSFTASSLASRITKSFDLHGGATAVDGGDGSTPAALWCCIDQLLAGDADVMICVGAQQDVGIGKFEGWSMAGLLTARTGPPPLDAAAAGVFPGEGCTVFLLKRLADARRDGDRILAVVRGVAAASAQRPQEAARQAVERALEAAGAAPEEVRAVEWSGLGTAADAAELAGMAAGYRSAAPASPKSLQSGVGQIGHAGGASGGAALLRAIYALDRGELPGTYGYSRPSPAAEAYAWFARPQADPQPWPAALPSGGGLAAVHAGGAGESAYHLLIERGDVVHPPVRPSVAPVQPPTAAALEAVSGALHFDATARRRERLRSGGKAGPVRPAAVPPPEPALTRPAAAVSPVVQPVAAPPVAAPAAAAVVRTVAPVAPAVAVEVTTAPAKGTTSPEKLEKFLVNFVVEQTGYPPEIVELDVDLEADLGIDSIKKAQLFGELREYFDIQPVAGMSLDDFPTLRHVKDFILKRSAPSAAAAATPAPPTPVATPATPAAVRPVSASPISAPAVSAPSAPGIAAPAASAPGRSAAELEKFLVNFVVEQTGYPPEIVELDIDLEADLGIDSIKKAQLFGELREYFDIQPVAGMSLDDFPTLRHVEDFILKQSAPAAAPSAVLPPAPAAAAPAPAAASAVVADSSERAGASPLELEKFLVNFVVEQTGYPPEIVELDVDLEADLGIDSIKKAQLFGELREYFDVQPAAGMSLDDFPTLRHVLDFLQNQQADA